jgi:hypothetical protein
MKSQSIVGASVFLGVFLATASGGCAGPGPIHQYAPPTLSQKAITSEVKGFRLSIDPILDSERSRQVFRTDAPAQGVLPILIRAENTSDGSSFLVRKASFQLSSRESARNAQSAGDRSEQSSTGSAVGTVGVVGMVAASALFAPLIFVGGASVANASTEQFNFAQAELRDQSVSPAQTVSGFIYFQVPKGGPPRKGVLLATIRETRNQQDVLIEIPFDY